MRDLHSAARTPTEFQESVLQNTSFPCGVCASGHRFPCPGGTSFRDTAPGGLRGTVSRNASFAGETSVLGHDERRTRQGISMNKHFFPFLRVRSPHLVTHASRCSRDNCSETRTPGSFNGPGHGTQAYLSSRSKSSEARIRELELYAGL